MQGMDEFNKTVPADAAAESAADVHQASYTTTPQESRVSSSNEGLGSAVSPAMPDPKEVTGQFDHLATRDPEAMEHRLQTPEFAGAQTTAGLLPGTGVAEAIVDHNNMSVLTTGSSAIDAGVLNPAGTDLNPGYHAPAVSGPPHVHEQPGDLPTGATTELKAELER